MDPENVQYVTLDGPVLPMVAMPITAEQRSYNPVLDHEALELELEVMLSRAGLENYATMIVSDHGIESASMLHDTDIKLFCRVARDRILFRKLLANLEIYYKAGHTNAEGTRYSPSGKLVKRKGSALQALGLKKPEVKKTDTEKASPAVKDADQFTARSWLVHGRSPIEMVCSKWEACYELRRENIANAKDLSELFQLYPIFRDPKSDFLITLDFDRMYPGATSSFYSRFPFLHDKLETLLSAAVLKDKAHQPLYDAYKNAPDGNQKDYLLCLLLPVIIQTNYRVKGNWKPSVKETQDSFILEVETAGDVKVKINQRLECLRTKFDNVQLQPQIITVGASRPDKAFIVVFGGAEYKAENILHAICIYMHVTYVMNLQYTLDCRPLWLFLQTYLYKIPVSIVELPKSTRDLLKSID